MNQSNLLTVRVVGVMNRQAVVLHAGRTLPCLLSGRLLRQKDSLAVGDRAEAEILGGGQYRLTRVLPGPAPCAAPAAAAPGTPFWPPTRILCWPCARPPPCFAPSPSRSGRWRPPGGGPARRALCQPLGPAGPGGGDALARRLEPLRAELDGLAWGSALEPPAELLPALRGKSVAVLGGPGCGKTALIQRLAGVQAPSAPPLPPLSPRGRTAPSGWTPRFPGRVPRRQVRPGLPPPALRESFSCKACGALVTPEGAASRHRNHCPHCLSSLHVDEEPGDRACTCRGLWSRWACGCARG